MNEDEILEWSDTSVSESSIEEAASSDDSSEELAASEVQETTIAYEDTVQYDVNYNFGYMSIWLGAIFGVLCIIAFMKGFGND